MPPVIETARGTRLVAADGREYIDLSMGYGSVWLGHQHPAVTRAIAEQLSRYAAPGYLSSGAFEAAEAALKPLLPLSHFLGGIYSTGMEAVEAALRAACAQTGRSDLAGFAGSEHGRSFVTAALGGSFVTAGLGGAPVHGKTPFVHCVQNVAELERLASRVELAAVIVEPIRMTGGGHEVSREDCKRIFELRVPVIFDEALTAPYRCGAPLFAELVGQVPDILVLGKGLGNGFPCAAVALRRGFAWDRARVRPGSTYWNHPLACAAVAATLSEIAKLHPLEKVHQMEQVVRKSLAGLELRGRGAMWCLALPDRTLQALFVEKLLEGGVVTSYYDGYIRLLPPLAIEPAELERACETIGKAHAAAFG